MVTSTAQNPEARSSLDHPGIHQAARRTQPSPDGPISGSPTTASPLSQAPQVSTQDSSSQPSPSSGPSVVSRYMLPSYQQANTPNASSSLSQLNTSSHPAIHPLNASLPDILHSHMVPQIPRLRQNQRRQGEHRTNRDRHRSETDNSRHRHPPRPRNERRRTQSTGSSRQRENVCKEPCVKCVVTVTSFRWVLVALSVLGVACVVSGVVLAALHALGSSFLFLAIMFIGLGILLVIVVTVGWKCTPRGHEPLHALFHIGQFGSGGSRERHRRRRHRHREGHWSGGVMYPEFQYRRPPPSYAASMQDYHNQSLHELSSARPPNHPTYDRQDSLPGSPPPSYHSRTSTMHSGMNLMGQDSRGNSLPNSRPPTYRSRAPSRRPSLPRQESPQANETPRNLSRQNSQQESSQEFSPAVSGAEDIRESSSDVENVLSSSPTSNLAITISEAISAVPSVPQAEVQVDEGLAGPNSVRSSNSARVETYQPDTVLDLQTIDIQNLGNRETGPEETDRTMVAGQPDSETSASFMHSLHRETFQSDVQELEQVLRPLEIMGEAYGIDNAGANISGDSDHYDTHL